MCQPFSNKNPGSGCSQHRSVEVVWHARNGRVDPIETNEMAKWELLKDLMLWGGIAKGCRDLRYPTPLDPKTMKNEGFRPSIYGSYPPKNEGFGFPWHWEKNKKLRKMSLGGMFCGFEGRGGMNQAIQVEQIGQTNQIPSLEPWCLDALGEKEMGTVDIKRNG